MIRRLHIIILLLVCFTMSMSADDYDPGNFKPENDSTRLERTNLPIVFIDTHCGADTARIIHKDWRIAVRMKIINNPDGINYGDTIEHPAQTVDYEGWIAIRYRGNTSFTLSPKKPYNFKTMMTDDVDGEKRKTGLLGMPKDHSWQLLSSYNDRSLLQDVLVFQLARPYFDYIPRCRYCELVLDGVYYGIFILTEKIRKGKNRLNLDDPGTSGDALTGGYQLEIDRNDEPHYYTSKHLAVDKDGQAYTLYNKIYFQYKHPEYEEMLPEQLEYIHQRIDLMEDVLASDDFANPETGYQKYLDPMSFIDQQLSQEFSGNVDAYRLSTNIYKSRDSVDPRFKTTLWDFNFAFGNTSAANANRTDFWRYENTYFTNTNAYNKVPFWWMRLMQDPAYVIQLKKRWAQYRLSNYSNERLEATIDSITSLLAEEGALERNNTTWKMFFRTTYEMQIDKLKQWIWERVAWLDEQLELDSYANGICSPDGHFKKEITAYYNLQGVRLTVPPRRGPFIVCYKDGTRRKVTH